MLTAIILLIAAFISLSSVVKFFIWAGIVFVCVIIMAIVGLNSLANDASEWMEGYWS